MSEEMRETPVITHRGCFGKLLYWYRALLDLDLMANQSFTTVG